MDTPSMETVEVNLSVQKGVEWTAFDRDAQPVYGSALTGCA